MTSLVSASQVVTGQVQSLDSVRAHALPSDAMIFASGTKVQPANQNLGSYGLVESANALTLTTTGSVPVVTQSPFADLYKEGSLSFSGTTGNYVSATATGLAGTQWNTTGLTVEAWVNYTTFAGAASQSGSSNQPNLLGFGGFSWQFGSNISGNASFYYWTNGTTPVTYMATTPMSTNTWNHITFTCTSSGTGYMFINGVQSQILTNTNGTISGPASTVSITGTPTLSGSTLYLNQNIGGTAGVSGYVADVRITTGAALYTGSSFTVPSAPLSTSATGVTQALIRAGQNSPTVQNGALTFDRGLKQFMNFGPQTFNVVTQGFTAIWRGQLTGTAGSYERLFEFGSVAANGAIFAFRNVGTNQITFGIFPSNGTSYTAVNTNASISQGTNYVFTFRYNPMTQIGDAWVNGVPQNSYSITTASLVADRLLPTTYVGYPTNTPAFLSASMNTLAVYNRALSNVEILNAYSALTTSTNNAPIEIGDVNGTPALSIAGDGRVNITKMGQTSNVLPWPPAAMTGYVTSINGGTYAASASYELSSSYLAWYAFDKNSTGTFWASPATYGTTAPYAYTGTVTTTDVNGTVYLGEWLQIQQPSSVTLSSYSLSPGNNAATGQAPAKWAVLGSRDGVNWTLVDQRSGVTTWAATTAQTFSVSASQAWTYFRIVINQANGYVGSTPIIVFGELILYGTADTAQPLTVSQPVTLSYGAQTASLTGISGDKYVPQDFSSSGLNIPAYVVSNTATTANTVQYSSFGPFAGEGSLYFGYPATTTLNQCGAYVNFGPSTAPNFTPVGTPMTIEGWMYVAAPNDGTYYQFMAHGSPNTLAGTGYDMTSFVNTGGFYFGLGSGTSPSSAAAPGFVYNAWNHVSGCWNGTNTLYASVNGAVVSQAVTGTPAFNSTYSFLIGAQGGAFNMRGYIACARVVRGAALYTTAFTPPTGPLQPIQGVTQAGLPYGTVLLLRNAPAPGRVLTSKFAGQNSSAVLPFPPAAMTGYATALSSGYGQGTYVASASSEYPNTGSGQVYALFDKVVTGTNYWQAGGGGGGGGTTYNASSPYNYTGSARTVDVNGTSYAGEWVQVQMPSSVALSNYQIQLYTSGSSGAPSNWSILGSRDGVNWSLVDQRSGIAYTTSLLTFSTSASQAFTYYRMVITQLSSSNTNGVVFAELVFNGTIEGPNVTADGRLGVGVSAPTQALEVAGSAVVAGTLSAGNPLMFRNALYNGDFRIAQRGTSFVGAGGFGYTLDRWYGTYYGAVSAYYTISQIQSGLANFSNALQLQQTSTSSMNAWLSQSLETRDVVRFQGQPVTVSFWYRIPVNFTGTWTAVVVWSASVDTRLTDSGVSYTVAGSLALTNTTSWTYASFQAFVPPTAQSLALQLISTGSTVNGATFQVTGVQLEKGSVATPFEVRPYATELALCQRYYWAHQGGGTVKMSPDSNNSSNRFFSSFFPVTMRASPTPTATVSTGGPGANYGTTATMYGWQVSGVAATTSVDISAMTASAEL